MKFGLKAKNNIHDFKEIVQDFKTFVFKVVLYSILHHKIKYEFVNINI